MYVDNITIEIWYHTEHVKSFDMSEILNIAILQILYASLLVGDAWFLITEFIVDHAMNCQPTGVFLLYN